MKNVQTCKWQTPICCQLGWDAASSSAFCKFAESVLISAEEVEDPTLDVVMYTKSSMAI